jgi:hypothetical protein
MINRDGIDHLDELHLAARDRGWSVGIRIVSFHPDRAGFQRQSLLGTLEVREADWIGKRFRDRELKAAHRLVASDGSYLATVDEAAETLLAEIRASETR